MKVTSVMLALVGAATAYPAEMLDLVDRYPSALEQAQAVMRDMQIEDVFNASAQYVKTDGNHRFIAPTDSDLRGLCPGLNALANHGYIPRNGYTTVHEATDAAMKVFGLGSDLAHFLATYAAVLSGDLTTWSIGGPPSAKEAAPAAGQILLGSGISKSHNIFESDASPTHPDTLLPSHKSPSPSTLFQLLHDLSTPADNYDIPTLTTFRAHRFHASTSQNPLFHQGPFTGVLAASKSYTFIPRLMSNHSAAEPAGHLSASTLALFFAMAGPDPATGKFTHKPGHERIPENWYRRSVANPYDNAFFLADTLYMGTRHPEFLSVGGNVQGRTDSFTSVNLNKLTGGTYGSEKNEGVYDFACLGYQAALHGAKDVLSKVYEDEHGMRRAEEVLRGAVAPLVEGIGCPRLRRWGARVVRGGYAGGRLVGRRGEFWVLFIFLSTSGLFFLLGLMM